MRISFHHANPERGNESFVLRFDSAGDETPCILVDAGNGVDLDALLKPTDRLVAICLTHAHLDHYSGLAGAHRDDVPILTSPATAAILTDVFDVAARDYDVTTTDTVVDAITPIDDWTPVAPGIDVHPAPAGHVPGAVGFLVRAADGDQTHHLLATGDFTRRSAGGFPGFDPSAYLNVDVLFLTGATDDGYENALTDALATALEHAHSGARTLLATSGLVGVQSAYLLSALADEYDHQVPIRVVGQVAKLYEALEYDCPGVESVPVFDDTDQCLAHGAITIAGPEIPHDRSSGRLFGVLRDDPSACVVQLIGSGEDPLTDGQCTMHHYRLINHPSRETLVEVHDAIEPTETVITHRHRGAKGSFNDLGSVVWGAGDTNEYTLFDGNQWRRPPWMKGGAVTRSSGRSLQQFAGSNLLASLSLPSLDRWDTPNLAAEGIDTDRFATLLHQGPAGAADPDAPSRETEPADTDHQTPEPEPVPMTTETSDDDRAADGEQPRKKFVRTTSGVGDEIDPAMEAMLEEWSLTPDQFEAVLAMAEENGLDEEAEEDDSPGEMEQEDDTEMGEHPPTEAADEPEEAESPGDEEEADVRDEVVEADAGAVDDSVEAMQANGTAETVATEEETATATPAGTSSGESDAVVEAAPTGEDAETGDLEPPERLVVDEAEAEETIALELNPLAVALVTRPTSSEAGPDGAESVDAAIVEAVERYVVALLAGEASGSEDERFVVDLTASPTVTRALDETVAEDDRFESISELASRGIASLLGGDTDGARGVRGLGRYQRQLDAVVQNEAYVFSNRSGVVEAAIAWALAAE